MMINSKCPTCKQAVPVQALQKFEPILPLDALSSLELTFLPEDRNVDLTNLLRLFTQKTPITLETTGWMDENARLHLKITPVPANPEALSAAMPANQASSKIANLMSSTREQLMEKVVELGLEFYPKETEANLRTMVEGELEKRKKDEKRGGKPKPEPVAAGAK